MIPLTIILDGDNAWPDLDRKQIITPSDGVRLAVLDKGMNSGRPSVTIRLDLPGQRQVVVAETSARLFCQAARIIMARYPKLLEGEN